MENKVEIFDSRIRKIWDSQKEDWLFSVVDVVGVLSESENPRNYWKVLKFRLKNEKSEGGTNCNQLKLKASDGKLYLTTVADAKTLLRIIQSIPSKKAEPFKVWLAEVGSDRLDEEVDPEISIDRAMRNYLNQGRSKEWINQRLKSIEVRKELTDEWQERGVKEGTEFGILTNEMLKTWPGMKVSEYKSFKDLKKENLRDNMTNLELVLNMLAEASTTEISKEVLPETFEANRIVAKEGGEVAKKAREELEKKTGKKVVSSNKEEILEDLEFAKRTEAAYRRIENGEGIKVDSENLIEEMVKW
jgi:hypothetical protein